MFQIVFVCFSGRSFSTKLSELHDAAERDCTPIIALFDVGSGGISDSYPRQQRVHTPISTDSPLPFPLVLRRAITFSSESDESYGLQLLSRIASDLQVEEGAKLIIPVAIVQPKRKSSDVEDDQSPAASDGFGGLRSSDPDGRSATIDSQMMLQCLDAGALDVVQSPLDKSGVMGLTVHAYRIYKTAKKEQTGFLMQARARRKQSWVGVEEEQPYAYLREAMVKKLLKGICEPENIIEDYQHRTLCIDEGRKTIIAREVGQWGFCGHDYSDDELVHAGCCMLRHALQLPELEEWRLSECKDVPIVVRKKRNLLTIPSTDSRAPPLHAGVQSSLQFFCPVSQFPPCCRRPPIALLFHHPDRYLATVPSRISGSTKVYPEVPSRSIAKALRCIDTVDLGDRTRRRSPRR